MTEHPSPEIQQAVSERFLTAMNDSQVPKYYTNSFVVGYGNADFVVMLESNNNPSVILNFSYVLAKTFAMNILRSVAEIERHSPFKIPTMEEMETYRKNAEAERNQG